MHKFHHNRQTATIYTLKPTLNPLISALILLGNVCRWWEEEKSKSFAPTSGEREGKTAFAKQTTKCRTQKDPPKKSFFFREEQIVFADKFDPLITCGVGWVDDFNLFHNSSGFEARLGSQHPLVWKYPDIRGPRGGKKFGRKIWTLSWFFNQIVLSKKIPKTWAINGCCISG